MACVLICLAPHSLSVRSRPPPAVLRDDPSLIPPVPVEAVLLLLLRGPTSYRTPRNTRQPMVTVALYATSSAPSGPSCTRRNTACKLTPSSRANLPGAAAVGS